ncbi:acyltransferase family protein [Aerococcus urinaeequi]
MVKNMRYSSLDGMKTIAAFLVICIHIPFPGEVGQIITAIARIAVPFFFMVSGFFASDNLKK